MDLSLHLPIERRTLDNGLRIVAHPDRSLPLVAVNLWVHVGSKDERPGRTGFAHLFEHMLFQGSGHVGTNDHFRHVQGVGGVANGSTWYDRTNYYDTLPSHHLELALWLESDRLGFLLPALTPDKLEIQRSVILNERRQRIENQPYGRALERVHELLYPSEHPYHWPVIGYPDDIAGATLEEVEAFFRTHYLPNNAVLTLAGDFDPDRAFALAARYFEPLPPGPDPPRSEPALPPLGGERREVLEDAVRLPRIYLAYRAAPYGQPEWYAGDLLAVALAAGRSSPLYRDLVYERQLAQDVSAYLLPTELAATFLIVATLRPGVETDRLEEALLEHLGAAAREPLAAGELERARNTTATAYFEEVEALDRRADLLSRFTTLFDDPHRIQEEAHFYLRPDAADLRAFAAERLGADQRVVVTVVPAGAER